VLLSGKRDRGPGGEAPRVWGAAVKEAEPQGHRSSAPLTLAVSASVSRAVALAGCGRAASRSSRAPAPSRTGVTFANRLPDDTAFNILTYMYYYEAVSGGSDVNNDACRTSISRRTSDQPAVPEQGDYRSRTSPKSGRGPIRRLEDRLTWPTSTGRLRRYLRVRRGLSHEPWAQVLYINNGTAPSPTHQEYGLDYAAYLPSRVLRL